MQFPVQRLLKRSLPTGLALIPKLGSKLYLGREFLSVH